MPARCSAPSSTPSGGSTTPWSSRASRSSSSPTGSPRPCGEGGRFGEERLRAELGGAAGPVQAVQRLEGALQSFTGGSLEDDVAILALAPASAEARAAARPLDRLGPAGRRRGGIRSRPWMTAAASCVERLFDAFNRRDAEEIVELCDEEMEFFAVTAEEVGRGDPYVGTEGLRRLPRRRRHGLGGAADHPQAGRAARATRCWSAAGSTCAAARSASATCPTAWIWDLRDGRFVRGRVFVDPEEAVRSFSREARPGPSPDLRASRSTTRLR